MQHYAYLVQRYKSNQNKKIVKEYKYIHIDVSNERHFTFMNHGTY